MPPVVLSVLRSCCQGRFHNGVRGRSQSRDARRTSGAVALLELTPSPVYRSETRSIVRARSHARCEQARFFENAKTKCMIAHGASKKPARIRMCSSDRYPSRNSLSLPDARRRSFFLMRQVRFPELGGASSSLQPPARLACLRSTQARIQRDREAIYFLGKV